MKIVYSRTCGGLMESLSKAHVFSDFRNFLDFLVASSHYAFTVRDIYISFYSHDTRLKADRYSVCVGRFLDENYLEKYKSPQIIGFCSFNVDKSTLLSNAKKFLYGDSLP